MPVQFTCPHCAVQVRVADAYRGKTGPCAQCGQPITIPTDGPSKPAPRGVGFWLMAVLTAVVVFVGGVCWMAWYFGPVVTWDSETRVCRENLVEIGRALESYHDDYGCYPPAWLPDADGRPQHSWRVLLLPYVGGQDVYDRYRFGEPWNSEHNQELADEMPSVYGCPASPEMLGAQTNYLAVVGPGMFFDPTVVRRRGDVTDPPWATIVLVEAVETGIGWMEPRDLEREGLSLLVGKFGVPGLSSLHPRTVQVLLADGEALSIDRRTKPGRLAGALTIAGGETKRLPEAEAAHARAAKGPPKTKPAASAPPPSEPVKPVTAPTSPAESQDSAESPSP